jgi:hypothetical protein
MAEPGTVEGGVIYNLYSIPQEGGRLVISRPLKYAKFIYGLVDPETGKPRVKLDILAKS